MTARLTKKEHRMLQAAADGDLGLVGSLLKPGAPLNDLTLVTAASHGHVKMVHKLLTTGCAKTIGVDEHGNTALIQAARHGHYEVVNQLLAAGANVNATNGAGESALTLAATDGHDRIVERLLAVGGNVDHANKRGTTALMGAAMYGHASIVGRLLKPGANVNTASEDGTTALITAASNGFAQIVDMLLAHGANVECASKTGETPLYEAAAFGHAEVVQKLIATHANVNAVFPNWETALIVAAGRGHEAVCHTLLRAGANLDMQTQSGETAVQRALKNGHSNVVALLQGYTSKCEVAYRGVDQDVAKAQRSVFEAEERALVQDTAQTVEHATPYAVPVPAYYPLAYAVETPASMDGALAAKFTSVSIASAPAFELMLAESRANITQPMTPHTSRPDESVRFVHDATASPYHAAVLSSRGDVALFQELLSTIPPGAFDPYATTPLESVKTSAAREAICAAECAYLLGYKAVGDAIVARMKNPKLSATTAAVSIQLEEAMSQFPFILAVAECHGNVDECLDCLDAMDKTKFALEDRIQATVVRERSQRVEWTPVEFACYLGYVDIVKELFGGVCSDVPPMTRIQAIKQARQRRT